MEVFVRESFGGADQDRFVLINIYVDEVGKAIEFTTKHRITESVESAVKRYIGKKFPGVTLVYML